VSSSIAITYTSLPYLLTIEFYIITSVYAPLSKPSVCVSVASRKAYKVVSYLVTSVLRRYDIFISLSYPSMLALVISFLK